MTIVSEEVGRVGNGATLVVVDPIDGSINAKRGIPFFSFSIAIAEGGETMDDVFFGFVHDFGTGEEWTATRGGGAQLNGEPLGAILPKDVLDIARFEATQHRADRARRAEDRRRRAAPPHHGLARAVALPPRRRPRSTASAR